MTKVIGMLVALAMFCAMPAAAFGDEPLNGGNGNHDGNGNGNGNGNHDGNGNGNGSTPNGDGGNGVSSGDIDQNIDQTIGGGDNNVQCAINQNAGGDAVATNNCGNVTKVKGGVTRAGQVGVGGGGAQGVTGVGGGGAQGVTLARTGFDAWVLAVIGGLSLAGGLGLLAAQRRGRIGA